MNPISKILGAAFLIMMFTEQILGASGLLRIAFPVNQLQLDPQMIEDMYSTTVVNQIFCRLFKYTPEGQVRPDLVDRWEVSKDKMEYTFYLKDYKFSDGTPITAPHVVNSLKRIFILKAALASDLAMIKGAKEFGKTNNPDELKIISINPKTVRIITIAQTNLLTYLLSVPDVGILKLGKPNEKIAFNSEMAFSGPYRVTEMSPKRVVVNKWRPSDLDSLRPPEEIEFTLYDKIDVSKVMSGAITDTSTFMTFDQDSNPLENLPGWRPVTSHLPDPSVVPLTRSHLS